MIYQTIIKKPFRNEAHLNDIKSNVIELEFYQIVTLHLSSIN